jgi:hypothetical protein
MILSLDNELAAAPLCAPPAAGPNLPILARGLRAVGGACGPDAAGVRFRPLTVYASHVELRRKSRRQTRTRRSSKRQLPARARNRRVPLIQPADETVRKHGAWMCTHCLLEAQS